MDDRYLQLFSIREELGKDFGAALKRVAEIGYTGVEFASGNYGGLSAEDMKKLLASMNLKGISTHIPTDQVASHVDYAASLGLQFIIDPMAGIGDYEETMAFAEKLNAAGKICKDRGIIFGYHNHRHEFIESKDGTLMDTLIINTDPDLVSIQLDVGWAACAGCDVPAFITKYAGRFKSIHVKETSTVGGAEKRPDFSQYPRDENGRPQIPPEIRQKFQEQRKWNCPAGKGIIDWPKVKDAALAQGAFAFIVEREYDYAGDIYTCIKEDCDFLKSL